MNSISIAEGSNQVRLKGQLLPLDQVRSEESEVTRKAIVARKNAERSIADARLEAMKIKTQARESGAQEGKVLYKKIVDTAEDEARAIKEQAQKQAIELQEKGQSRMELAVQHAVSIVLGPP